MLNLIAVSVCDACIYSELTDITLKINVSTKALLFRAVYGQSRLLIVPIESLIQRLQVICNDHYPTN